VKAIATFERTLLSGNSPYDKYQSGKLDALSNEARIGMNLFFDEKKTRCSKCHSGSNFMDNSYHNTGIGTDPGRSKVSRNGDDGGRFKAPTLRDVAKTGPYMHDGSVKTLEDVVEYYVKGVPQNQGQSANGQVDESFMPLDLNDSEIKALITFLREGLASDPFPTCEPPELPQ